MRIVNPTPPLPRAPSHPNPYEMVHFDGDLVRTLTNYLTELAARANGTLPIDGSEAMGGNLDMGGFDIINVDDITADDLTVDAITMTGLLTTNGQIAFPATQNPSTNVNTLDDYEEGTWTPTLQFNSTSAGITYSSRTGAYIKVGKKVTVWGWIALTNAGAQAAGSLCNMVGFPFTAGTSVTFYAGTVSFTGGFAAGIPFGINVVQGTSTATIYKTQSAQSIKSDWTNTSQMSFSVTYEAAA